MALEVSTAAPFTQQELPGGTGGVTFRGAMTEPNSFISREYPVLHSIDRGRVEAGAAVGQVAHLSLALLVTGIPSFLATVPVPLDEVDSISRSLSEGDVRVAVVGMSVGSDDLPPGEHPDLEPWKAPDADDEGLPGALLSLVCRDGRRIGVARIVARERKASPDEVARFVLRQIAKGVQIPDLASTG